MLLYRMWVVKAAGPDVWIVKAIWEYSNGFRTSQVFSNRARRRLILLLSKLYILARCSIAELSSRKSL